MARAKSAPALHSQTVQWALDTAPWHAPDSPESEVQAQARPSRKQRQQKRQRGSRARKRSDKAKIWRIIRGTVKRHLAAKEREDARRAAAPGDDVSDSQGTFLEDESEESVVLSSDPEVDPESNPASSSKGPDPAVGALAKAYDELTGKTAKSADDQCQ